MNSFDFVSVSCHRYPNGASQLWWSTGCVWSSSQPSRSFQQLPVCFQHLISLHKFVEIKAEIHTNCSSSIRHHVHPTLPPWIFMDQLNNWFPMWSFWSHLIINYFPVYHQESKVSRHLHLDAVIRQVSPQPSKCHTNCKYFLTSQHRNTSCWLPPEQTSLQNGRHSSTWSTGA